MMDAASPTNSPATGVPSRLRVGDAVVDLRSREVTTPGASRPYRLTPKALGVLRVLAANAGEVVERNQVFAAVWPDTMPTDDVLTQAITQLRRAFGEERGSARYIETIAKSGYRLMAAVTWEPAVATPGVIVAVDAAPATGRTDGAGRSWRRGKWWMVVSAGLLAVVAVLAAWLSPHTTPADREAGTSGTLSGDVVLITSLPGYELSPSLSPDATRVAYSATRPDRLGTVIMVQATGHAHPIQLSFPPDAVSDQLPEWSPDGRDIAYLRAPAGGCEIRVAAVDGGAERVVGRCNQQDLSSFSWTPDGSGLLFGSMTSDGEPVGIRRLALATGTWHPLDYPLAPGDLDHAPRHSPDGRWIVFVRNPQQGHLWRVPAAGGKAEQLTRQAGEILGWDWLPGGDSLVFSRRMGNGTRLYRLDIASGEETALGIDDAQHPDVAASGAMTFVRRQSRFGLFRFAQTDGADARTPLFPSSGRDTQPALAPDGAQLVFTSDRAGRFQLWWSRLDDPSSLRPVEGITPATGSLPQWSPDASRMLVVGHADVDAADDGLHEVFPATGQVVRVPVPGARALQGNYLPDSGRLLVVVEEGGPSSRLVLYDRRETPWKELASLDDVSRVQVDDTGGRVLFTRLSANGLWQSDLELAPTSVRKVVPDAPARWRYRTWAVAPDGRVLYIHPQRRCSAAVSQLLAASTGGKALPAQCLDPEHLAHPTGFSTSGDHIFVSLATADGTDIAFVAAQKPASH